MAALLYVAGIASLVCWIIVLIKMFENAGVVQGIIGIICGLWAFIWGWMNAGIVGRNIMIIWTICIVLSAVARGMGGGLAG